MSIIDSVIIIFLLVSILGGFRRGLIKESVLIIGLILVFVISWYLRVPVATYMYKHLPFFGFNGMFKGISVLNILVYELLSFLAVFSILITVLLIVLKVSGLVEKLLKITIIFGAFSKVGGAILGLIEGFVILYIVLFVFSQPFINIKGWDEAVLPDKILKYTPVLSNVTEKTRKTIDELYSVAKKYKDMDNNPDINKEMIDVLLKYDIISEDNLNYLREKGKIE